MLIRPSVYKLVAVLRKPKPRPDSPRPAASRIDRRRKAARSEPSAIYAERRDQLLSAAGAVFKKKGFQQASVNDIAAEVAWDRASVYYYYSSKEEIFLDLVRRVVRELVVKAEAIAATPESATARLQHLVEMLFEVYEEYYPYLYLYIQEDMSRIRRDGTVADTELAKLDVRFRTAFDTVTTDGTASGEFRPRVNPQLLSLAVLGAVNWSHRWYVPTGPASSMDLGRAFADFFINGVRATSPERRPAKPAVRPRGRRR